MALSVKAVLALEITPAAVGNGNSDATLARPFRIYDANVLCTVADGGGAATAQLLRQALGAGGFTAVTNAMACTAAGTIARAGSITVAERNWAATDVIRLTLAGGTGGGGVGTQDGTVYAHVIPTTIASS